MTVFPCCSKQTSTRDGDKKETCFRAISYVLTLIYYHKRLLGTRQSGSQSKQWPRKNTVNRYQLQEADTVHNNNNNSNNSNNSSNNSSSSNNNSIYCNKLESHKVCFTRSTFFILFPHIYFETTVQNLHKKQIKRV